jgi:hypothetical protein
MSEARVQTGLRLSAENHRRLAHLAADLGISQNAAMNALVAAAGGVALPRCVVGHAYPTREAARTHMRTFGRRAPRDLGPYECRRCGEWHVGGLDQRQRHGKVTT